MGLLGMIGLKTVGAYCFYTVGKASAVLVGAKLKHGRLPAVPARIGKYTVRGIDHPLHPGPIGDAFSALDEKIQLRIKKKLEVYHSLSDIDWEKLPETVEYLGYAWINTPHIYNDQSSNGTVCIPSRIHYIREIGAGPHTYSLVFPESLRYLGKVSSTRIISVAFTGPAGDTAPYHSLSDYLGQPVDEMPRIEAEAFSKCTNMTKLTLSDSIQRIGKGAMPPFTPVEDFHCLTSAQYYYLHIPRLLQEVEQDEFRAGIVSTLTYPDDLSEALRCRKLPLQKIGQLIIRDWGQLEQYTHLLSQGQDPETFPDKCLYHLMRRAECISLPQTPRVIFDGMFADCRYISRLFIGPETDTAYHKCFTIAHGVEVIGNDAFRGCTRLNLSQMPASVRHIGDRAFYGCNLRKLLLPEGTVHIGQQAFAQCSKLRDITIPSSVKYFPQDAFQDCPELRLTPTILQRLEAFPAARDAIVPRWEQQVLQFIQAGDSLLLRKRITIADKQSAYEQYRKALELNPFNMSVIYKLERLLLTTQVPHCITTAELEGLLEFLKEQQSLDALCYFTSSLEMLDNVCVILSDPGDMITQRLVYGLNCDQSAAIELLEFLLDTVEKHPRITDSPRYRIRCITGQLLSVDTRNNTPEGTARLVALQKRNINLFGCAGDIAQKYNVITKLTSEQMMDNLRKELAKNTEEGYHNGEFWAEMARAFNPSVKLPEELARQRSQYQISTAATQQSLKLDSYAFPPDPLFPDFPSFPYTPYSPPEPPVEDEDRLLGDQIISEYWANVAAQKAADELEELWGDLASIGFWNDTSWQ